MNRMKSFILAVVLGCLISPAIAMASPVYYTAVGSVIGEHGGLLPIVGEVNIDDQLRDFYTGQPTEWHDEGGYYIYPITDYSLQVGQQPFSGDNGTLLLAVANSPMGWYNLDFVWFLEDGQGAWTTWIGEDFYFYNADLTLRNISQYGTLPEVINLVELTYIDYPFIDSDYPNFSMWLVRKDGTAPVPEPTTMALLGASALGMFLHRRRGSRRNP